MAPASPFASARRPARPRYLALLCGLVMNGLFNHDPILRALGAVNARLGLVGCVFLAYPPRRPLLAQRRGFRALADRYRWRPAIAGVFRQGRAIGVAFGVTASEPELLDLRNAAALQALASEMERIRRLLRADRCAFAGLLPSLLNARGLARAGGEGDVAAECVLLAIDEVRAREGLADCPVLVLGSRGFVGGRVVARLADQGRVYAIDHEPRENALPELPGPIRGGRAILVNITWAGVLDAYIGQMWPGLVVLNEYPPLSAAALCALEDKGVAVYHLAGVEGAAFPAFPDAYAGGIPCCAASPSPELRVRVVPLVQLPPKPDASTPA